MHPAIPELLSIFHRCLPSRCGHCEISLASSQESATWIDENGCLHVALRLTIFDSAESDSPRDIKEQHVYLGNYEKYPPERWMAYVEGHLRALPAIVQELRETIECAMPMDLFAYGMALNDESLQNADDFVRVLSDPERLRVWNEMHEREEWREMLAPCGLGNHVDEVRAMSRPALRMSLEKVENENEFEDDDDEADWLVGISRVGGDPALPPSFEWPEVEGEALTFVAQINLEEIARRKGADELPKTGLLSFFYAAIPPGNSRGNPVRVIHFPDVEALERRASPKGVERMSEYTAEFSEERLFPAVESHYFYESVLPKAQVLQFYEALRDGNGKPEPVSFYELSRFIARMNEVYDERPTHRLLGHPDSIQGDPYLDVEVDTLEGGWDDWKEGTPEAMRIRKNALRWRLLLQIDAQEADDLLLNQDGGFFYFFIPAEALAKHDWTQARGVLQCH